jgi:hypothetical protein
VPAQSGSATWERADTKSGQPRGVAPTKSAVRSTTVRNGGTPDKLTSPIGVARMRLKTCGEGIASRPSIAGSQRRVRKVAIMKRYPTIGACGLDCGMCPRYYTAGPLRCPGCGAPDFVKKHSSCSFITCCVKKRDLEVCGECPDFPCPKFKSDEEYRQVKGSSSYPPYRKVMPNLKAIKEHGIARFMEQQTRRIRLLEGMIAGFDDGRSRSYYCRSAALLDPADLDGALDAATQKIKADRVDPNDAMARAKLLRAILEDAASKEGQSR